MQTAALVTWFEDRINANLTRPQILDMINNVQNEVLANDNGITRIKPDPFIHTGSESYTSHATNNTSGAFTFEVQETITTTNPTKGYLLLTQGSTVYQLKYTSYSGSIFTLADGVSLPVTFTSVDTAKIDDFNCVASGSIFSSTKNSLTTQWDIRRVNGIYTYSTQSGRFFAYGGANVVSYKPNKYMNRSGSAVVLVEGDATESKEPNSEDCIINFWHENAPGETTNVYLARSAHRWPTQVTTESINLEIPDRFHTTLIRYGLLKDLEYTEYGSADRPQDLFDKYLAEFLIWSGRGVHTEISHNTVPRRF